jgi:hypothetical protein
VGEAWRALLAAVHQPKFADADPFLSMLFVLVRTAPPLSRAIAPLAAATNKDLAG